MRLPFLAAFVLNACAADPVLLPDAGPCSSACGAGTVCQAGACVAVDAGSDAGTVDVGAPEDRPSPVDLGTPDVGADAGPMDAQQVVDAGGAGACGDASVDLRSGTLLPTGVFTNCGACGVTCTQQQRCSAGACAVRCPNGPVATCDGRNVDLVLGERDGGLVRHCGQCGNSCAAGEQCDSCICAR